MEKKEETRKTPDRTLEPNGEGKEQRRGSNLLAAAGIGYEARRKLSHSSVQDVKVLQKGSEVLIEDKDGNMTKMQVVQVEDKVGILRKAVPTLPICLAILFCLSNVFLPGVGTFFGAISLLCCGKSRHENNTDGMKYGILAAIIQIITAFIVVGWIYSIMYGVNMVQDSMTNAAYEPRSPTKKDAEG